MLTHVKYYIFPSVKAVLVAASFIAHDSNKKIYMFCSQILVAVKGLDYLEKNPIYIKGG
jgi:hypothetical protein